MKTAPTLATVSEDRRYDEKYAEAARKILRAFVQECGTQGKAAEALGVHQSAVSRSASKTSQPTLKVLIALREKIGLTIDEMLGLEPIALSLSGSPKDFTERLRTLLRLLESQDHAAQVRSLPSGQGGRK